MTTHVANISYLTDIRFGAGALQCLPDVMDTLSMTRPLVVTDAVLRDLGFVDRLGIDSAAVFDGVPTNPTEASVMQGVALFRQSAEQGFAVAQLHLGDFYRLGEFVVLDPEQAALWYRRA
ncbi:MAG: iron-containing alcohol dehydrogenase, partial [Phycisphaeraceae bacterium]|nr:iron-containing alcohol dehydrogenase [Phycisphaeraceae bacterium]